MSRSPQPSKNVKKQPVYDPSELDDLIFSPAVGSGVASHLLDHSSHVTTDDRNETESLPKRSYEEPTTVARGQLATVVKKNKTTVCSRQVASVVESLWRTESGDLLPGKKVRRIHSAVEALSDTEEAVYTVLWTLSPGSAGEGERSAQAGYDLLVRKTQFSRKTIQRVIDKLLEKGFIEIQTPADIYARTPTVYRVLGFRKVWERLSERDRLHVARIGPGVVFAHPFETTEVMSGEATVVRQV